MFNMSKTKVSMPEQDPNIRNRNFLEVSCGYSEEMAKEEALRCLMCKTKPCVLGCPVNVKIPEFIQEVAIGNFEKAYYIVKDTNSLPAVCGRVCPQETQCEAKCVRGIKGEPVAIGRLERFVADWYIKNKLSKDKNTISIKSENAKVAIIGSGPSGLTCASSLASMGYHVTIFEAFHTPGGVLTYGIPEFRLPKEIVDKEIESIKSMGVNIIPNMVIGKVLSIDELLENGYKAVYISSGAGLPSFLGIEGEELVGVYSANELLTRINLMKGHMSDYHTPIKNSKSVAIIGGGNVAMDAARSVKRVGAENVYIIYRRSEKEMPARLEEIHHAKAEGVLFKTLSNPVKILGDSKGHVKAIECVEMELQEPDSSGRRRPVPKKGSNFKIDVDAVVVSIGTSPNPLISSTTKGLEVDKWGCIIVDEYMKTTKEGVYAGGDAVSGADTVIKAMGAGKIASESIDKYIKENIQN